MWQGHIQTSDGNKDWGCLPNNYKTVGYSASSVTGVSGLSGHEFESISLPQFSYQKGGWGGMGDFSDATLAVNWDLKPQLKVYS